MPTLQDFLLDTRGQFKPIRNAPELPNPPRPPANIDVMKGVNPRLVAAVQGGATYLPEGYTIQPTSGHRPGGDSRSYHARGQASDWQIIGPDGRAIPNKGEDTTGMYTHLARGVKTWVLKNDPELSNKIGYGGAFGTKIGGGGVPDLMHYDLGGSRGQMRPQVQFALLKPLAANEQPTTAVAAAPGQRPPPSGTVDRGRGANVSTEFAMQKLQSLGFNEAQSKAIVGNMVAESSLQPTNVNTKEGAYGLMQWRGERFTALNQFAQSQGKTWRDPNVQLEFIAHEMKNNPYEARRSEAFRNATTVEDANRGLKDYIRYGTDTEAKRLQYAKAIPTTAGTVAADSVVKQPANTVLPSEDEALAYGPAQPQTIDERIDAQMAKMFPAPSQASPQATAAATPPPTPPAATPAQPPASPQATASSQPRPPVSPQTVTGSARARTPQNAQASPGAGSALAQGIIRGYGPPGAGLTTFRDPATGDEYITGSMNGESIYKNLGRTGAGQAQAAAPQPSSAPSSNRMRASVNAVPLPPPRPAEAQPPTFKDIANTPPALTRMPREQSTLSKLPMAPYNGAPAPLAAKPGIADTWGKPDLTSRDFDPVPLTNQTRDFPATPPPIHDLHARADPNLSPGAPMPMGSPIASAASPGNIAAAATLQAWPSGNAPAISPTPDYSSLDNGGFPGSQRQGGPVPAWGSSMIPSTSGPGAAFSGGMAPMQASPAMGQQLQWWQLDPSLAFGGGGWGGGFGGGWGGGGGTNFGAIDFGLGGNGSWG